MCTSAAALHVCQSCTDARCPSVLRMTEPWQKYGTQSMLCISSLLRLKLASALYVWYLLLKACPKDGDVNATTLLWFAMQYSFAVLAASTRCIIQS